MIQEINIGAAPNDKTGDPARLAGQKINENFNYLDSQIKNQDQILEKTTISLSGQDLTMGALWRWLISGVQYSNPIDVVVNIPYAASGMQRIDAIVCTTSNTFQRIAGPESASNPVQPVIPSGKVLATIVLVNDASVGEPTEPVTGSPYQEKAEFAITTFTGSGAVNLISMVGKSSRLKLKGTISSLNGIDYNSADYNDGQIFYLHNNTTGDVILNYAAFVTGKQLAFMFHDGNAFTLKGSQIAEFQIDLSVKKLVYVGVISSGSGGASATWNDRGNYNPVTGLGQYPTTGGSGIGGAILKGDVYIISGIGAGLSAPIGTKTVNDGDEIRALAPTPGQTDSNWAILEGNYGYIPENVAEKQNNMSVDGSGNKYPTVDAVNNQVNNIARASLNVGMIDVVNEVFNIVRQDDTHMNVTGSNIGIVFPYLLTTPPFAPSDAVKQVPTNTNYPLSSLTNLGILAANTQGVFYLGWRNSSQNWEISTTTYLQNPQVFQAGVIFLKNVSGVVSFIDTVRTVIVMPDVCQYSNLETTAIGVTSNVTILPNSGGMTVKNSAGNIIGVSANYKGSNNDEKTISAGNPITFLRLNPGTANSITLPAATTTVNTTDYWNGTAMVALSGNARASVQRFLLTVRGTFNLQPGEVEYANFQDAKDNITNAPFTDYLPKGTFVEICRVAAVKNASDLGNNSQAVFFKIGSGGSSQTSSSTVQFADLQGQPTDNANLNAALAVKAPLTTDQISITTSQNIDPAWNGKILKIKANVTLTVPNTLPAGFSCNILWVSNYTVAWAITSPKTWSPATPSSITGSSTSNVTANLSVDNENNNLVYLIG